jgi:hypothetical protein
MNPGNLKKVQQHALQYWFVDGWAEIAMGLMGVLLAVYFWMIDYTHNTRVIRLILTLIIFVAAYGLHWALLQIKERTTYPRSGYVEPQSWWGNKLLISIWIAFTIFLFAAMLILYLNDPQPPLWPPLLGGLIFGLIFASLAYYYTLPRYYYLTFFSLVTSGGLAFSPLSEWSATALLSGLISLILLAFGLLTRRAYLSQNPQSPEHESHGG